MGPPHMCPTGSKLKSSMADTEWVAMQSMSILKDNPKETAKNIQTSLGSKYNIVLPYYTVWKGKEKALGVLHGDWTNSFGMLYNFKAEVQARCPGSVVEIDTESEGGKIYFKRFFMALKPCIDGFKGCYRPYLSVDSTVLTGKWKGCLPSATALNGHN